MPKRVAKGVKPPKNYVAYYTLCDAISGQIEEAAKRIGKSGIHAPLFHQHIVSDLESLKGFCDRAIHAVNTAQADWNGAPTQ
jgi:hypothetical protein